MSTKTKSLVLTAGWPDRNSDKTDRYRVEVVTDSIKPKPGEILPPDDVESYCLAKDWKVTIKPFPRD